MVWPEDSVFVFDGMGPVGEGPVEGPAPNDNGSVPSAEEWPPPHRGRRAAAAVAKGIAVGVLTLAGCGIILLSVTSHTAGATISGHIEKQDRRMDGLVVVDPGDETPPQQNAE